jgi:translation initiation factor 3 subunit M
LLLLFSFPHFALNRTDAQKYLLKYLETFSQEDFSKLNLKKDVIRAIVEAIKHEDIFNFEGLLRLKAVEHLKGEKIYDLLQIFLREDLNKYHKFAKDNASVLKNLGLSNEECVRKMRLLSIVSLAETANGPLSYQAVSTALGIPEEDVEIWIIDGKREPLNALNFA